MKTLACLPLLLAAAFAQTVPDNVIFEKDIEYSNVGGRMALDIARPNGPGPYPLVVAIHGGGFRAGRRESYHPLILKLAQRGYAAATISYRLSPRNQFPAPVHDAKASVRFLRANAARFRIDPTRVGVTGGSAGGHLALFLGLTNGIPEFEGSGPNLDQSSSVSCVVSYYGPTDFTKSYGKSVDAAEVLPLFLGGDLEHARAAHIRSSPLNWVTPSAPPILSIHGTKDRYVAYEQSLWLMDRLKAVGAEAELETLEGADHGFKGPDAERAERRLFEFFDKHLGVRPPQRRLLLSDHGPKGEVVLIEWPSGRELWTVPNQRGHDVQALPNGHVLYTIGPWRQVVEMDAHRQPVWIYGPAEGLEHPISAQRLPSGNTLIGDAQLGKVIEVERGGKVVWKYESPDLANMRMRRCLRTPQGTTLISIEAEGRIIEVDAAGKIVWSFTGEGGARRRPYQGWRLANGNTLIGMTDPGEIVEVDPSGKIVRSVGGRKLDIQLGWASGIQPLDGGGFLVSDYTGRRILEIGPDGGIVHELRTGARTVASIALAP
jgi:acetyl esterase/lipase